MNYFSRNIHLFYLNVKKQNILFIFLFLIFFWNSPSIHENFQLVIYVSAHKHAFALDRQILPMN